MFRKILLISAGLLSVILGAIGIILPILPTTPFLLLAAACFIRSSDKLYQWLIHHKWFGAYIRNYREHKAITLKSKIIILFLLWLSLGYSIVFVVTLFYVQIILLITGVFVTIYVLRIRTFTPEFKEE